MPRAVTPESFEQDVIEASRTTPVLVDFWAPWCRPCVALAPTLELMETEAAGRWRLAKVDVEAHSALGAAHGISSIPALRLYVDGRAVGESLGAQPRPVLEEWLRRLLPGEERAHLDAARVAERAGDDPTARREYEAALAAKHGSSEATVGLARVLLASGDVDGAEAMAAEEVGPEAARVRLGVRAARGPSVEAARATASERPGEATALHALGVAEAAAGRHREALEALLEAARRDARLREGEARQDMLDVFEVLGPGSELADDYRRRLAMLLF